MQFPKINISKKYLKIGAWVLSLLFVAGISVGAVAYSKREAMLHKMVAKAIAKAEKDFGIAVKIEKYGFAGLSKVRMSGVTVVPNDRDTLAKISDVTVGVKIWPLLVGNVKLSELNLTDGTFNVVLKDSLTNIDFILKRKKKDSTTTTSKVDLSEIASNLLNQVFYKIPDDMEIKNFMMQLNDNDTAGVKLLTTTATIDGGELKSTIKVNDTAAVWHINGDLDPSNKRLDVLLFADGKKVELPYLENKLHAKINFDTVRTQMKDAGFKSGDYRISGSWAIKNLLVNQKRLSADDITVPAASIEADMIIGENFVALDSTSTIHMRDAVLHPYLKYTLSPNKIYEVKLKADEQEAQALFNSFPGGLFESLDGIKVQGKLKYSLDFYLDATMPDSVKFSSSLTPTDFKVLAFGKTDLQKINSEFIYTPYEYGKPMRDIKIGTANGNFTRLADISPNFKNALLTSEDPSFFKHRGFVEESIRKSIAVNYKEKKFKRGGSTISMQLVKNIFLSRKKTLSRKAEEILIVWLIENGRLVTKERMLEVYFNIIEMGNNVYGIGEAARYYFGKTPADLTVGEGIFLANIVPKPKVALYKFMSDGSLKGYMLPYFKYIGNIMAKRGLVQPDSSAYGYYNVRLREGLRKHLQPDSTTIDTATVDTEEDDMMTPEGMQDKSKNLFDRLFGGAKKDSAKVQSTVDTAKTKKQIRQQRREERRKEKENTDGE